MKNVCVECKDSTENHENICDKCFKEKLLAS